MQAIRWRLKYAICVVMVMKCSAVFLIRFSTTKFLLGVRGRGLEEEMIAHKYKCTLIKGLKASLTYLM